MFIDLLNRLPKDEEVKPRATRKRARRCDASQRTIEVVKIALAMQVGASKKELNEMIDTMYGEDGYETAKQMFRAKRKKSARALLAEMESLGVKFCRV